MKDLEGQVEETIGIHSKKGVVFDGICVRKSMQIDGIKLRCQTNVPPTIAVANWDKAPKTILAPRTRK